MNATIDMGAFVAAKSDQLTADDPHGDWRGSPWWHCALVGIGIAALLVL